MSQQSIRIDAVCPRWADDDRPTQPEQITSAATPIGYIQAGERLMEKRRQQQREEAMVCFCLAAVRRTKYRLWRWRLIWWSASAVLGWLLGRLTLHYWGMG